jgi:hypothetical protein
MKRFRWEGAMDFTTSLVVAFILFLIYAILRTGIRIGVKRAITNIVDGFLLNEEMLAEVKEQTAKLATKIKNHDSWYNLFGSEFNFSLKEHVKENRTKDIRQGMHELSSQTGQLLEARISAKEDHEADVRMDRRALEDVAWLADYGFRVWIARNENEFRFGERLNKESAEKMKDELESFERKIAIDRWAVETEEEKEMRFNASLNRMQLMWEAYG